MKHLSHEQRQAVTNSLHSYVENLGSGCKVSVEFNAGIISVKLRSGERSLHVGLTEDSVADARGIEQYVLASVLRYAKVHNFEFRRFHASRVFESN